MKAKKKKTILRENITGVAENLLGSGMGASNLAELCFIIAHQEVNAVLCSIFNVRHLFADATVDDVLRRNAMTVEELELRLKDKCKKEENVIINCCKTYKGL